jgi:hypothetical protein
MRKAKFLLLVTSIVVLLSACTKSNTSSSNSVIRTFRMGFENSAPSPSISLFLEALNLWLPRADAAIFSIQVPWDSLYSGESAVTYVINNFQTLTNIYRSNHYKIWVYIDPENGLNRTSDADDLVALGKSIAQVGPQQVYRRFVLVMDSIIGPDHLGLALETNLIRAAAPDSIYQGVKQAANAASSDVRAVDANVKLSVSVQVEEAWGVLGGGNYQGIAQDFSDFPFIEELGFSSYPYFAFANPSDIPSNYYSRLIQTKPLPVFISEGGWTSHNIPNFAGVTITSNPSIQAAYIDRQGELLSSVEGIGLFQLTVTDIDLSAWPAQYAQSLQYFAYLGVLDSNLQPKPAWSSWDSVYQKPLKAGN